jgi:hypothetical protein
MRTYVNYAFDLSAMFYFLWGVGIGFGSVYRRYDLTTPFIFDALWSVLGVRQGGLFQ